MLPEVGHTIGAVRAREGLLQAGSVVEIGADDDGTFRGKALALSLWGSRVIARHAKPP